MRPRRLEIEGFSAFRDRTVVAFDDTDLVGFVGPTGSGKSSIIDAITFALYGSVARYHDDRMVAPVINAQSGEARVRLDFEVAGRAYTAVRVVRRTKTGAATREARLEHDNATLAGDAKTLDAAVVGLLGLTFEQFTKTVVLPQGEFAAFLDETPAKRQELLVRLLDLGVYGEMAKRARGLAASHATEAKTLQSQLDEIGDSDADDEGALRDRAVELDALREALRGDFAAIDGLDRAIHEREADQGSRRALADRLRAVRVPADVESFAARQADLMPRLAQADDAVRIARDARDRADAAVDEGADVAALTAILDGHHRRHELTELLAVAADARDTAAAAAAQTADEIAAADAARQVAQHALEHATARAGMAELRHLLHEGEPCPVCEQPVVVLPELPAESELADARDAARRCERRLTAARAAHEAALRERLTRQAEHDSLAGERERLALLLDAAPDESEARRELERAHERREGQRAARRALQAAEAARDELDSERATLERAERELRRALTRTRDALAALTPPAPDGTDIAADWQALARWAAPTLTALDAELERAVAEIRVLADERSAIAGRVELVCRAHDVDAARPRLLEHLTEMAAAARAGADRLAERRAAAARVAARIDEVRAAESVASTLGQLLGANGFERWLLDDALDQLVAAASVRLFGLSSGQFSLARSDKDFVVRDHRNADDTRSVKTLSGGETFLASLALALALADNVAAFSTQGSPKLESIFLDEGFGTLDPDTLDVVAAAIEELGASGRMVGVITHVRDLADRLPVRYEVSKLAHTSVVQRVER